MRKKIMEILTPEYLAMELKKGRSLQEVVEPICSKSRGYQLLKKYQEQYPDLFPRKKMITKKELEQFIKFNTIQGAAEYFGVSVNTIRRKMKEWEIERTFMRDKLRPSQLQKLVKEGKSDKEIAKIFGCSAATIANLRYMHGIYRKRGGGS